jgi:hydrogenase nickel incorporation protein HypB
MCKNCGCSLTPESPVRVVEVIQDLLVENDRIAAHNRAHFDSHGVLAINVMSSPGAGKTALLEATIVALKNRWRIAVIEGDLATDNDAVRIRSRGVPAIQITTGAACHLDAQRVHEALHALPLAKLDLLFIENVGNLVCPATFDLGAHRNVTLLSVTEGDDKPAKYPVIFCASDLVVLSKTDLLDVMDDFDPGRAAAALQGLGGGIPMIRTAVRRAPSIAAWLDWIDAELHGRDGVYRSVPARNPVSLPSPTGFGG